MEVDHGRLSLEVGQLILQAQSNHAESHKTENGNQTRGDIATKARQRCLTTMHNVESGCFKAQCQQLLRTATAERIEPKAMAQISPQSKSIHGARFVLSFLRDSKRNAES